MATDESGAPVPDGGERRGSLSGQSIHVPAVDPGLGSGGEWVLRGTADGLQWEHGHQKADVARTRAPLAGVADRPHRAVSIR